VEEEEEGEPPVPIVHVNIEATFWTEGTYRTSTLEDCKWNTDMSANTVNSGTKKLRRILNAGREYLFVPFPLDNEGDPIPFETLREQVRAYPEPYEETAPERFISNSIQPLFAHGVQGWAALVTTLNEIECTFLYDHGTGGTFIRGANVGNGEEEAQGSRSNEQQVFQEEPDPLPDPQ
jgi:hypothetical protein